MTVMEWVCGWLATASLVVAMHYRGRSMRETAQLHRLMAMQSTENLRRMLHDLRYGFPDERARGDGHGVGPSYNYTPPVRDGEIWALISGDSDAAIIHALITVTGTGPT